MHLHLLRSCVCSLVYSCGCPGCDLLAAFPCIPWTRRLQCHHNSIDHLIDMHHTNAASEVLALPKDVIANRRSSALGHHVAPKLVTSRNIVCTYKQLKLHLNPISQLLSLRSPDLHNFRAT